MIKSKNIGKKIRQLRESIDYSQAELAKAIGISREVLSNIENGIRMPKLEEIDKLASFFHCSIEEIISSKSNVEIIVEKKKQPRVKKEKIRVSVPQKNLEKFKEVFLYILNEVGAKPNIGKTVIQKLLYFIDFDYYEKFEEQLIGATYIKNKYGPTPIEFMNIVDEMLRDEDIVAVKNKRFDFDQIKYLPLRKADLSGLNANELSTIENVLERLSDMSASQLSDYSHNDIPWIGTEDKETIDYEAVFYRTPAYSVRQYFEEDQN